MEKKIITVHSRRIECYENYTPDNLREIAFEMEKDKCVSIQIRHTYDGAEFMEDRYETDSEFAARKKKEEKNMKTKKFRVEIREYDSFMGNKIDEIKEFDTIEEADDFITEFNCNLGEGEVPEVYWKASPLYFLG